MRLACDVCRQTIVYHQRDSRYLFDAPVYCGLDCLLNKIISYPKVKQTSIRWSRYVKGDWITDHSVWSETFDRFFESRIEVYFALWLKDNKIPFDYEPYRLAAGPSKIWVPDFHITNRDIFIETKGVWHTGAKTKVRTALRIEPDLRFIFVPFTMEKELRYYCRERGFREAA